MFKQMFGKMACSLGLTTILFSSSSYALPIVEADAFAKGDNKAVLETSTGLVWMDFGVNSHLSFDHVVSLLPTEFTGWRLPTVKEVDRLWTSLFSPLPEWNRFAPNFGSLTTSAHDDYFASIFGVFGQSLDATYVEHDPEGNVLDTWTAKSLFGVFMEDAGASGWVSMSSPYDSVHSNTAMYFESNGDVRPWFGTLLVKDTPAKVPEPASIALLLLALAALAMRNHRLIQQ